MLGSRDCAHVCAPDPVGVELVSSLFHLSVHLSNRVSSRERRLATSLVSFPFLIQGVSSRDQPVLPVKGSYSLDEIGAVANRPPAADRSASRRYNNYAQRCPYASSLLRHAWRAPPPGRFSDINAIV
jgi:hypothetical protein